MSTAPHQQTEPSDEAVTALLRQLAEQASEHAILLLGTDGRIRWCNLGAERIFAISRADVIGRPFSSIFTPDDLQRGIDELEWAIASSDATAQDDRWHMRADGSRFWSSGALVPLRAPSGEPLGFGKIVRNRTDLKEQLEQSREEARVAREAEINQKIGMATLAHELRNVLAVFTHGTKMLRSQGATAERRAELVGMMEAQASLLRRLTDDLLDIARVGTGKMQLDFAEVVLQECVRRSLEGFEARIREHELRCELLAAPQPIIVSADAPRLRQVLVNLLDNAIKYSRAGGRIWIKVSVEDAEAVVRIEDDGIGIPPERLADVFGLFTQVDTNVARQGLGIGLSLVKNLVSLHGGTVQAHSLGAGKGSEFTVRLPLKTIR